MTEELKQKAEESAKQNCPIPMNWNEIDVAERAGYVKGYIAGATEVTKELQEENEHLANDYEMMHNCFLIKENEVKKLQEQIEKMKCCSNCRHSENDNKTTSICDECFEMCYWELRR